MKFDRDLFISYAHIDNESLTDGQDGWVSMFHRGLEIRLAQLRGEKPRIWRDQKLQGNDDFSDTILEQFPNLALLVSILSPRYVKSTWCLRELENFAQSAEAKGGLKIGDKARIFKVIKTYLPRDKHPQALDRLLGYEFFDIDDAGRPREFSRLYGADSEHKFWAKLEDLAYDIQKTLDLLEALPETDGPAVVPGPLAAQP
ncbi:TIR domain-containing protein, partial [Nodosilinea sp. LEGE 07298]|uniref:TIR domain-containing protein n=1 Tax=Nodosilinea sp. LEGE 07298 TaxID=2777970 RepID=UPI00188009B0